LRLDKFLTQKGFVKSRNKAIELIKEGFVKVNEKIINKPSFDVNEADIIKIEKDFLYVSRAALKLKGFLEGLNLDIKDRVALDIGASSGGFTQVLLEYGAKKVYALDVGKNQLDKSLAKDQRVVNLEQTDLREFFPKISFDIVTCDVSFISLKKLLKDIKRVSKKDVILLFKPQFEVGKEVKRDKKGVVLDEDAIIKSKMDFEKNLNRYGFKIVKEDKSKISGKEGNIEFFYYLEIDYEK